MSATQSEDSRPTHPRTVTTHSGERTYHIVLSPRAMRAITSTAMSWEDVATDCHRRKLLGESRSQLMRYLKKKRSLEAGWSDYADAVAAAVEVGRRSVDTLAG